VVTAMKLKLFRVESLPCSSQADGWRPIILPLSRHLRWIDSIAAQPHLWSLHRCRHRRAAGSPS
jgi:hypothetical protein